MGEGGGEFFFEFVELGEIICGSANNALLFACATAFAGAGAGAHGGFNTTFPVAFFTPTCETEFGSEATSEIDGFSRSVPGEIQVGWEVNVCLKDVAIDLDLVLRVVFF